MDRTTATNGHVERIGRSSCRGYSNGAIDHFVGSLRRYFKRPFGFIHLHRKQSIESLSRTRRLQTFAYGKDGDIRNAFRALTRTVASKRVAGFGEKQIAGDLGAVLSRNCDERGTYGGA